MEHGAVEWCGPSYSLEALAVAAAVAVSAPAALAAGEDSAAVLADSPEGAAPAEDGNRRDDRELATADL